MKRKKTLGFIDLVLFTFSAIFGLEAISATAAIGFSAIFWWILCAIGFFLPFGLITAELGSTFPQQGGMYVWIRQAFGRKWAARGVWYYWIALPLWIPAILISVTDIVNRTWSLHLSLWEQIAIGIAAIWITVGINLLPLSLSKWIPNIGSITKLLVVAGTIGAAGLFVVRNQAFANTIAFRDFLPTAGASIVFIPMIIYNLLGFELMSGAAGEMKNPARDIPRTIILTAFCIICFYLVTTCAIWAVVPISDIHVSSGLFDVFAISFSQSVVGSLMRMLLGVFLAVTLYCGIVTWTLGENRTMGEVADEGDFPKVFSGGQGAHPQPVGASVISGIISTVIIIVYGTFAGNASELFWSTISFSTVINLFSYLMLFPAFIVLRTTHPSVHRPFRVPGPDWVGTASAVLAELFVFFTILILCVQPGKDPMRTTVPILVGTVLMVIIGELLLSRGTSQRSHALKMTKK